MARSAAGGAPGSGRRGPVSREGSPRGLCGAHLQRCARDTHPPRSKRGQKGPPHHPGSEGSAGAAGRVRPQTARAGADLDFASNCRQREHVQLPKHEKIRGRM